MKITATWKPESGGETMKQPIISNLKNVNRKMIDELEEWLKNRNYGACPFEDACGRPNTLCRKLFDNLEHPDDTYFNSLYGCPCSIYGEEETILAFTIMCDVWKVYHKEVK